MIHMESRHVRHLASALRGGLCFGPGRHRALRSPVDGVRGGLLWVSVSLVPA